MIAYKGFEKDLSCTAGGNRFQYRLGVINTTEAANCRKNGFHCAEDPLDCLSYYSDWDNSVYYIVDAGGDINEDGEDSKISCTEMLLLKELTMEEFLMESLIYISNHPLRKMNGNVRMDEAEAYGKFVIVRGKQPIAKGVKGAFLGFAREDKSSSEINDIAVYKIDGVNFLPDTWYTVEGVPYEKGEES